MSYAAGGSNEGPPTVKSAINGKPAQLSARHLRDRIARMPRPDDRRSETLTIELKGTIETYSIARSVEANDGAANSFGYITETVDIEEHNPGSKDFVWLLLCSEDCSSTETNEYGSCQRKNCDQNTWKPQHRSK